jgi:hypothetical protein
MVGTQATSAVVHVAALSAVLLEKLGQPETAHLGTPRLKSELEALNERAEAATRTR